MESVYSFVDIIRDIPSKVDILADTIKALLAQTVQSALFIREYVGKGFGGRLLRDTLAGDDTATKIDNLTQRLRDLRADFDTGIALHSATASSRLQADASTLVQKETLSRLRPEEEMDFSNHKTCLPSTRQDVLRSITNWITEPSGDKNVLWLHGVAGAGKSTISTTIARRFQDLGRLGAFLIFDRAFPNRSHPSNVVKTLAYELAMSDPRLAVVISAAIEADPQILKQTLKSQFTKLIIKPLAAVPGLQTDGPVVIVLDALDECGDPTSRRDLLDILQGLNKLPVNFRIVITSRAEVDIRNMLELQDHVVPHELDLTSPEIHGDILIYFQYRMAQTRLKYRALLLAKDWPGMDTIEALCTRACGLFIWAATASDFIHAQEPLQRLHSILQAESHTNGQMAIDAIYRTALEAAGDWTDEDFIADFRLTIGSVLVAKNPPSCDALDELLRDSRSTLSLPIVLQLGCVLQQSPAVRVLHPSFLDFLSNKSRAKRSEWFFEVSEWELHFGMRCVLSMGRLLHRNMCNLVLSRDYTGGNLSEPLSYACLSWADHLGSAVYDADFVKLTLGPFLHHHFLHWIEAMSILRKVSAPLKVLRMIRTLLEWIEKNQSEESTMIEFVNQCFSFIKKFLLSINDHPLLVYDCIKMAPTESVLYQCFRHIPSAISSINAHPCDWDKYSNVPKHDGFSKCHALSPDNSRVAVGYSMSSGGLLRIWDVSFSARLRLLNCIKTGHESVFNVEFSYDGSQIVSCGTDGGVKVWDGNTGLEIFSLSGHDELVTQATFSRDGALIASIARDQSIRVWDISSTTEDSLCLVPAAATRRYYGHVAFSPDSKLLLSCGSDFRVVVWNLAQRCPIFCIQLDRSPDISHVPKKPIFSADGGHVIVTVRNERVAWEIQTARCLSSEERGHYDPALQEPLFVDDHVWITNSATGRIVTKLLRYVYSGHLSFGNKLLLTDMSLLIEFSGLDDE